MIDELVKANVLMMHKPVTTISPSLVPSQSFLNGSEILLTKITNVTFLFTAKKSNLYCIPISIIISRKHSVNKHCAIYTEQSQIGN